MNGVRTYPLSPDFKIAVGGPWDPPHTIKPRVDEIWASEKKKRGDRLTNGRIYCLDRFSADSLAIFPSEYRYALAQRRDPDLQKLGLNIRPLAVTGILRSADGFVFGRRGSNVADNAGLWEPAPAGGLFHDDPKVQVLEELEEELGIAASKIVSAEACGLVEDMESNVFDIVFRLLTPATGQHIQAAYTAEGSDEYAELAIINPAELRSFLDAQNDQLLPSIKPMLSVAGIL